MSESTITIQRIGSRDNWIKISLFKNHKNSHTEYLEILGEDAILLLPYLKDYHYPIFVINRKSDRIRFKTGGESGFLSKKDPYYKVLTQFYAKELNNGISSLDLLSEEGSGIRPE